MEHSYLKRAAAIAVAVCVAVTFIPLLGDYAVFADEVNQPDSGTPAVEEPAADLDTTEATEPEVTEPSADTAEPAADLETKEDEVTEDDGEGEEPPVKNGLITEDGVTYLYVNDEKQSGLQNFEGALYYFDPETFAMVTGAVKINGALYYFFSDGKAVTATNAWFKGNDSTSADRYALGGGKIASGAKGITEKVSYKTKVKKKYKKKGKWKKKWVTVTKTKNVTTLYMFDANTGRTVKTTGFYTIGSNTYYGKGNGKLAVKWNAIDNKAYYFYPGSGVQAKGTTIGYLKIPASGYLGEAYALGIKKLNSTGWSLKQAYKNSYKIKYQGRWWRQKSSEAYALKGFKKNKGNCYVMAATFYIQAKLLGYNVRQIHGKVAYRAPHSWTQINTGSGWRVYDPNFKNETGRNGWNIYYGKKGTWRYTNYSVFQN